MNLVNSAHFLSSLTHMLGSAVWDVQSHAPVGSPPSKGFPKAQGTPLWGRDAAQQLAGSLLSASPSPVPGPLPPPCC